MQCVMCKKYFFCDQCSGFKLCACDVCLYSPLSEHLKKDKQFKCNLKEASTKEVVLFKLML